MCLPLERLPECLAVHRFDAKDLERMKKLAGKTSLVTKEEEIFVLACWLMNEVIPDDDSEEERSLSAWWITWEMFAVLTNDIEVEEHGAHKCERGGGLPAWLVIALPSFTSIAASNGVSHSHDRENDVKSQTLEQEHSLLSHCNVLRCHLSWRDLASGNPGRRLCIHHA